MKEAGISLLLANANNLEGLSKKSSALSSAAFFMSPYSSK